MEGIHNSALSKKSSDTRTPRLRAIRPFAQKQVKVAKMTTAKDLPDPATRKRILAAMKRRDWDLVNAIVEGYPIVRRALARRESYAVITNARFVNGIVRFVKELGIHGDYRIVSVKRRVRIASDGAEPVVELAVPRSKPLYELERWCGSPTPGKRGAWKRLPFPTEYQFLPCQNQSCSRQVSSEGRVGAL